jgi:hypothetical protein
MLAEHLISETCLEIVVTEDNRDTASTSDLGHGTFIDITMPISCRCDTSTRLSTLCSALRPDDLIFSVISTKTIAADPSTKAIT